MKRSSFLTWEQIRVAALIVVAITITGVAIYQLGLSANLFSRRYDLIAFINNANGLRVGGPVMVAGQIVGTIEEIEFLPVDADTSRNLKIRMSIDEKVREHVREDSKAKVKTLGLLGDKVVDISPGTPKFAVIQAGDTIPMAPALDYEALIAQASTAIGDVVQLAADLRTLTGGLVKGQGTIGQLLTNRTLFDHLNGTLGRTDALLTRIGSSHGTLARFLDDPTMYNNMVATIGSMDSLVRQFRNPNGSVGRLLNDTTLATNLMVTLAQFQSMATTGDSVLKMIAAGKGLAGKMLTDDKMYDSLQKLVDDLNAMIADVRRDPRKYMQGLVRVKVF